MTVIPLEARLAVAFKAYDIRGRVPEELDADAAYGIGRAFTELVRPKRVAVGRDMRLTSPELAAAVARGVMDGGADVLDIGLCGTEEVYHASFSQGLSGGIMVTASHNPANYNGMKLVREDARPVSGDSGLFEIQARVAAMPAWREASRKGRLQRLDLRRDYVRHLLSYVQPALLKPLTIVTNAGNGVAGPVIDALEHE